VISIMLINVLALIVVLGVLIFVHEGGHFLAARAVRARITVFSLGFGRRLTGFRRGETDYRISMIPLGGYVRIPGLGPDESDVVGATEESQPLLPRWQRAVVLLAGPAANIVGAVLFLAIAFMIGTYVATWDNQPPRIGWVEPGSPAAAAGIAPDDLIVAIDGEEVATWRAVDLAIVGAPGQTFRLRLQRGEGSFEVAVEARKKPPFNIGDIGVRPLLPVEIYGVVAGGPAERAGLAAGDIVTAIDGQRIRRVEEFRSLIEPNAGRAVTVTVERDGAPLDLAVTPRDDGGRGVVGVSLGAARTFVRVPPLRAPLEAIRECGRMTRDTFAVLGRMLSGRTSVKQLSGPIEIARFSGEAARTGTVHFIWLLGAISLQLAIFNLLPVPVLDGGHLAVIAMESALRRDFSMRVKERILTVGFWLIIALVVIVLYNDVMKNLPEGLLRFLPGS
jgi:regulator of sigma E protease